MNTIRNFRLYGIPNWRLIERGRKPLFVTAAVALLAIAPVLAVMNGPDWMPAGNGVTIRIVAAFVAAIPCVMALLISLSNIDDGGNRIANAIITPICFGMLTGVVADLPHDQTLSWLPVAILATAAGLLGAAGGELLGRCGFRME